jgi:16S rRNA (guanine(966)-N(2))-methyltransferase RsmD
MMKKARPTSDLVLQALFNILGPGEERSFLDLFSGTGRVGIGALSKGFAPVVMVDTSIKRLNRLAELSGLQGLEILAMDVRKALSLLNNQIRLFDVIFADPPYETGWVARMASLRSCLVAITKDEGVFVLEHTKREAVDPAQWGGWFFQSRAYGDTLLTFFTKTVEGREPSY